MSIESERETKSMKWERYLWNKPTAAAATHTHTHTGEGKPYFIFETRHNIDKTNSGILFSNVLSRCCGGAAPTLGHAKGYPEIYTLCK